MKYAKCLCTSCNLYTIFSQHSVLGLSFLRNHPEEPFSASVNALHML